MYEFSLGEDRTVITYKIEEVGDDLEITITGGVIHIGGIALVTNGGYDMLSVRNHKEYEIIQPLAQLLTKYEDINILIKAGIHLDDIELDEIKEIIEINKEAVEKIDKYICSEYDMFHEYNNFS